MATEKSHRINSAISVPEVRVMDIDGEPIGILKTEEALRLALKHNADLVEISPNAKPPVCRIIDYGKYRYQQQKRAHESKMRQKVTQIKEVKFRPVTNDGDYQVKLRNIIRFLTDGDKTKISLRFRGREITHQEFGREVMERLKIDLEEFAVIDQEPKMEGRQMTMMVAPKRKGAQAKPAKKKVEKVEEK